jgi:multidrug efflux system outer membrane protein
MDAATRIPVGGRLARAVACGVALALPACQIPTLGPPGPPPVLPASYNGGATPDSSAQLKVEEFFTDPELVRLIYQGLAGNQELKILEQNIRIAEAEVFLRRGALFPFVTLRAGAGLDRSSAWTPIGAAERQLLTPRGGEFPDPLPDFLVAANVSWQVDIWRKLRNARDAATLRYLGTADGRNYVVTRLVADVAENYYGLLALDQRLATLDETIALQQRSLDVAKAQLAAGRGTQLAVQRFQAEVRKNQSEKLIVRQDIVETENRINFLLGRYPQRVERPAVNFLDLDPPALAVGVPAQLLLNRPDVRRAERELAAAGLEVKVARAEFFPQLDITAGAGYRAFNPRYLFNPEAFIGNVAGDLVAPLVNRTAIQTVYRTATARQLQALYDYQRTVLDAYTEVVNRVSMAQNYRASVAVKRQQLEALEASIDAANKLFQAARGEYLDVLLAQRDYLDARVTLIETKRQQLSAVVSAYQALGGGGNLWELFQSCPPPVPPAADTAPRPQLLPDLDPASPPVPDPVRLPPPRPEVEQAPPPRPVVPAAPKPLPLGVAPAADDEAAWVRWSRPAPPAGP